MSDIVMKQNDRRPYLDCVLQDRDGPVDLTGETVRFVMRSSDGTVVIDQTSTGSAVTVTDSTAGAVRYAWRAGDTATPGAYLAEWELTAGGERETFPNDRPGLEVWIRPEQST